jgi:hypothetical protein
MNATAGMNFTLDRAVDELSPSRRIKEMDVHIPGNVSAVNQVIR